jgi:DNA-binding NarL/FixJ family response regulator
VRIDLEDSSVRFALCYAVERAGWIRTRRGGAGVASIADRVSDAADEPIDVLVVPPTPAASRGAMDAFARGAARAVIAATDPAAVPRALEAVRLGLCTVSQSVAVAARDFPSLTPRLERTLLLVLRGRRNKEIARDLRLSEATVKRDLAELLHRFGVPNRVTLVATALRLGLPGDTRP